MSEGLQGSSFNGQGGQGERLPPGPGSPRALQTMQWMRRPMELMERCRERHGKIFSLKLGPSGHVVMIADPRVAKQVMTADPELFPVREWILGHHEHPDGQGYPKQLNSDEIPLEASILAVADAYEAMTADRVYRPALGPAVAREELLKGAGSQFDRRVVEAMLRALDREGSPVLSLSGSGDPRSTPA
ncbi:MAG: HD domain-containing protein [Solirubrobacterales bacterium]|nr:HD domain-containing protein [Solirubrobacterales bacterium]